MMATQALTQQELHSAVCDQLHCESTPDTLFLKAGCCAGQVDWFNVHYEKPLGELVLDCGFCGREVARFAVKESPR